jgi:hypothetical protein
MNNVGLCFAGHTLIGKKAFRDNHYSLFIVHLLIINDLQILYNILYHGVGAVVRHLAGADHFVAAAAVL